MGLKGCKCSLRVQLQGYLLQVILNLKQEFWAQRYQAVVYKGSYDFLLLKTCTI